MASFKRALTVAAPRCIVDVNGSQRRRKQAAIATYQWFRFNWHSFRGQRYYPPCSTCPAFSKSNKAIPCYRELETEEENPNKDARSAHIFRYRRPGPSLTFIKLEFHWLRRHMCAPRTSLQLRVPFVPPIFSRSSSLRRTCERNNSLTGSVGSGRCFCLFDEERTS